MRTIHRLLFVSVALCCFCAPAADGASELDDGAERSNGKADTWLARLLDVPYAAADAVKPAPAATLQLLRQDYERLERNRSVIVTPMRIGAKRFVRGLGTHSFSQIRILSPEPMAKLTASVGVDLNDRTTGGQGSVRFAVVVGRKTVYRSAVFHGGQEPETIGVENGVGVRRRKPEKGSE